MSNAYVSIYHRDPYEIVTHWLEAFERGELESINLKETWRTYVPKIYSPERHVNCLQITYNDELANQRLFGLLDLFLANKEEPEEFFKKLSQMETPPSICGKVFKSGEPTYTCRDCALDPTCVLCVACFKQSKHNSHKYKISTSSGGGYCDCGDPEAWKAHIYCDSHLPKSEQDEKLSYFPKDLAKRAEFIFEIVLDYCYIFLTGHTKHQVPTEWKLLDPEITLLDIPSGEVYGTVLYNDETHTFDLVIQTLQKAVECTERDAVEFATIIDREGRSIVNCSDFSACHTVKVIIEKQTSRNGAKPLRVVVMQSHVIAHETFATKLLGWLEYLLGQSTGLRSVFRDTILRERNDGPTILEGVLMADSSLWKATRAAWHRLFITGMLKDYDTKKDFAIAFSKHYVQLMKEFIDDDHEHSFSITSLSVQIYTVPTIAHYLIEHYDIFYTIVRTLLWECERKLNTDRKLQFEKGTTNSNFKRINYAMLDLKYLLTSPPAEWNMTLRKNLFHATLVLLELMSFIQEMDAVVRQVGQHMEYEPEWETAFNLHIKLAPVISQLAEWCTTDKELCTKIYRQVILKLSGLYSQYKMRTVKKEVGSHSVMSFVYDIASQPVSVHLPLTRFWAALHVNLESFGLSFSSTEFNGVLSPEILIEPSLRTQVLSAQVAGGMWKRNGYAILNQLYFYQNVRCRSEMLDKDILALQIGAAVINPDEFLIHCLNRYNLVDWADSSYDDRPRLSNTPEDESMKSVLIIAEEFLNLVVTLFAARYVPGVGKVTKAECIKKEVIQILCISSMTHSALNKMLVENVNNETGLELVIEDVATFKRNPTSGGTFELKPELYAEFDSFHFHYSREEQSKAEEAQRLRKKEAKEAQMFPPPTLPAFCDSFAPIVNILNSDTMIQIITNVLKRSLGKTRSSSDMQLRKVLHLISHGLNEEIRGKEKDENLKFNFTEPLSKANIPNLIEELLGESSISSHHELIKWILSKYHYIINPNENIATLPNVEGKQEEERRKNAKRAAESRAKLLAKMNEAQKNFMTVNADLFEDDSSMDQTTSSPPQCGFLSMQEDTKLVALGLNQSIPQFVTERHICILCQEEGDVNVCSKPFVMAAFIQRSTVLCSFREKLLKEAGKDEGKGHIQERDPLIISPELLGGPVITCCGHVMHINCWSEYYEHMTLKERRRPYRLRQPLSFDIDKHEYLCPLCQCISNTVIPLGLPIVALFTPAPDSEETKECSYDLWIRGLQSCIDKSTDDVYTMPMDEDSKQWLKERSYLLKQLSMISIEDIGVADGWKPEDIASFRSTVDEAIYKADFAQGFLDLAVSFLQLVFTIGLDTQPNEGDFRPPLILWQTLSYTIMASEAYHRDQQIPFFGEEVSRRQSFCHKYLLRIAATSTYAFQDFNLLRCAGIKLVKFLMESPPDYPCILEADSFSLLVSLCFSYPFLFCFDEGGKNVLGHNHLFFPAMPTGKVGDYFILELIFTVHIVQILLVNSFQGAEENLMEVEEDESGMRDESDPCNDEIIKMIRKAAQLPSNFEDYDKVWVSACDAAIPFLRCCAKFFEHATMISPPASLTEVNCSFEDLTTYLGLPKSRNELFKEPRIKTIIFKWINHPRTRSILEQNSLYNSLVQESGDKRVDLKLIPDSISPSYPRKLARLVSLPQDYSELINSVSLFSCQNGEAHFSHDSRSPSICLICGTILCSQSYCCQKKLETSVTPLRVGACAHHSYYCGGGIGIFLRIRECKLFCISGLNKGWFYPTPYLDEYGETDEGFRRGNPMSLSSGKYEVFRRYWILHSIPEEIGLSNEKTTSIVTTEWQYL